MRLRNGIGEVSVSTPILALRLVASASLVAILAIWQGEALMAHLLGPIRMVIDLIDHNHVVRVLRIDHVDADTVIYMKAGIRELIVTGSQVTFADPRAEAVVTTPLGAFLIAPSILLTLVLGWPARNYREWALRVLVMAPLAAVLFAIDAPFVLDAYLWELHRDAHAPDGTSPILAWKAFLAQGGRFILGGLAALTCLAPTFRQRP
ncbi:MAG: hypothetical protein ABIF28_06605 [Pseudomonadota bacterium]